MNDNNISPLFNRSRDGSKQQWAIVSQLLKHEGTGEAIKCFAKHCDRLTDYNYWFILGTLWVSYSGWSDLQLWKQLFSSKRPNREICLMKPNEYLIFQCLPWMTTVYRAHRENEQDWIAYTLKQETAGMFAAKRNVDKVSQYQVKRPDVLCVFTRRGEEEILVLDKTKPVKVLDLLVIQTENEHAQI